ncbi:hypothetical protein HY382_01805 [Candidatus Curtissbacteria bacterium]|nr:hypothetical protein [Candidatus Curtissbacteria bacterium]
MTSDVLINEKIKVWAFFDETPVNGTSIFPIAVSWRRRLIRLDKLIFSSSRRVGHEKILGLVCRGENANYELEYNTSTHSWRMRKVMSTE